MRCQFFVPVMQAYYTIDDVVNKICNILVDKIDEKKSIALGQEIKTATGSELFRLICAADNDAINVHIVNQLIKRFSNYFEDCNKLYSAIKGIGLANAVTYYLFMVAAIRAGAFIEIQRAFEESKAAGLVDEKICAVYIDAAGRAREFEKAKQACDEAKARGLISALIFNNLMAAAMCVEKFSEVPIIFNEAIDAKVANADTYTGAIVAAKKIGKFAEARAIFLMAKKVGLADDVVCANYISLADFEEARATLLYAKGMKKAGLLTYATFIEVAGKFNKFLEAQEAFTEAKALKLANSVTYNNFIVVAGRTGHFIEARQVYNDLRMLRWVVPTTYANFIEAAWRAGEFVLAHSAFEEARSLKFVNAKIYNQFLDAAIACGEYELAKIVFAKFWSLYKSFQAMRETTLDLRGHSFGAAYLACYHFLISCATKSITNFSLILDDALTSGDAIPPVQEAVMKFCQIYGINTQVNTINPDEIICNLSRPFVDELKVVEFSFFQKKVVQNALSKNKKLDPDAPVFIPKNGTHS